VPTVIPAGPDRSAICEEKWAGQSAISLQIKGKFLPTQVLLRLAQRHTGRPGAGGLLTCDKVACCVASDVDAVCAAYEAAHGIKFGSALSPDTGGYVLKMDQFCLAVPRY